MSFCNVYFESDSCEGTLWQNFSFSTVVDVIKLFSGGNLDFPKLRNWIKFVVVTEPAQKC